MKEKIYTIPITESYEQDSECPFCFIEKNLENDAVSYALGAAMMEPDYRIISNDKGYCNKHFSMMLSQPNKLSLALVLETHIAELTKKLENIKPAPIEEKGLFSKKEVPSTDDIKALSHSCVICDKIEETLKRYTEVFFYMWEKDDEFKEKVLNSKGFCMKHYSRLVEAAYSNLKHPEEFTMPVHKLQLENLKRIYEDVHRFTLKFDYRNKDMEWGTAQDAPKRCAEKLRGYTIQVKEEQK